MRIIGCDLHARQQTLAMPETATGEVVKTTLKHEGNSVREFYSSLVRPVRVGIATGLLIAAPQTDPQSHSEVAQPPQIAAAILHIRIPPADQVSDRDDQEPAEIHHI